MPATTIDFYDEPLLYDIIHTPGTSREVDGLERLADAFVEKVKGVRAAERDRWFEPACGSGRYLRVAARRGRAVAGLDLSASMIEYAQRRAGALGVQKLCRFVVGDMTDFSSDEIGGRVGLAFNTINTFRHLMTDKAALDHLRCVAGVLAPGGVYAVGISLTQYGVEFPSEDVWAARRGSVRVRQVVQYVPPESNARAADRREQVLSHFTVTRPAGETEFDAAYELRTYDPVEWLRLIERSAMTLEAVVDEDGNDVGGLAPGYAVCVLRPRA